MIYHGSHLNIFATFSLVVVLIQFAFSQNQMNNNNGEVGEVSVGVNGDLYGIFKKRLEKFNNGLAFNTDLLPDDKRDISNLAEERPNVRECLYEEYKKRLDRINNEISLDAEEDFDKTNRNSLVYKYFPRSVNPIVGRPEVKFKGLRKDIKTERRKFYPTEQRKTFLAGQRLHREIEDNEDVYKNNDFVNFEPNFNEKISYDNFEYGDDESAKRDYDELEILKLQTNLQRNKNFDVSKIRRQANLNGNVDHLVFSDDTTKPLISSDLSPSYPSVLTRAFQTEIIPTPKSQSLAFLSTVASKLNTSQLDLAKKLATITDLSSANIKGDPKLTQTLQKYLANTVSFNSDERPIKESLASQKLMSSPYINSGLLMYQPQPQIPTQSQPTSPSLPQYQPPQAQTQIPCTPQNSTPLQSTYPTSTPAQFPQSTPMPELPFLGQQLNPTCGPNITNILEKVLNKLEKIQEDKLNSTAAVTAESDEDVQPDGAPCEILGHWNSYIIGLRFYISQTPPKRVAFDINKARHKRVSGESTDVVLNIGVQELVPPKVHNLMNTSWKFTGSSMKHYGGPFFMISKNRSENMLATFAGFCRTCGGIDTIFGTWTFVYPSNDCQDISLSIETKRDMFRRDLLESKRKERLKEVSPSKESNKCLDM